tara:strand:+ start:1664 stop:4414 length:2751 start_codon:yes stop_codon:yes gene_type:complete
MAKVFEGKNIKDLDPSSVVVTEEPSTSRKFAYESTKDPSFSDDFAILMESYLPIATYFSTDKDRNDILAMESPEQRREYLYNKYTTLKENQYADVLQAEQLDPWAKTLASISGEILDPISAVPFGHGIKWAIGGSAVLGSVGDALDQYVETGEIDLERNLKVAAVSAVGGGTLYGAGKVIGKQYAKAKEKKLNAKKEDYEKAKVKINKVNEVIHNAKANGADNSKLNEIILDETGFSQDELLESVAIAGDDIVIPTNSEAALGDLVSKEGLDAIARMKFPILSKLFEPISNTLYKISPRLSGRLRDVERLTYEKVAVRLEKIKPFVQNYSQLTADKQVLVSKYLGNQNYTAAKQVFKDAGLDVDGTSLDNVSEVLLEMADEFNDVGVQFERMLDYFPRSVKDLENLRKKFGVENKDILDEAKQIFAKQKNIEVKDITAEQEAKIIESILSNRPDLLPSGGFKSAKERKVLQLTDDILEYYDDPAKALENYIRFGTSNIEERAFFGKGKDIEAYDLDSNFIESTSVGEILAKEGVKGDDLKTIKEILKARFLAGKQRGDAWSIGARNLSYLTTIVNPFSALIQLGDIGTSMWINGVGDTMAELINQVSRGKKQLTTKDLGLEDVMAEEFTNTGKWALNMHNLFTYSGFRKMDTLGKNTFIGASLRRAQGLAKTKAGKTKLAAQNKETFGNETDQLISDLENGVITDNVKKFVWDQLSDAQPISLSEMPLQWLLAPNGRVMYSLKTFAIRQISTGLKRTLNLYEKGARTNNKAMKRQALKNLVSYFAIIPTANMTVEEVKDYIKYLGNDVEIEDETLWDKWSTSLLKMYGGSEWAWDKVKKGEYATAGSSILMPPVKSLDRAGKLVMSVGSEEGLDTGVVRDLPVMGQIMYYWFGDGIEKEFDKNYRREISKIRRGEE